jgi:hypothetical protein
MQKARRTERATPRGRNHGNRLRSGPRERRRGDSDWNKKKYGSRDLKEKRHGSRLMRDLKGRLRNDYPTKKSEINRRTTSGKM